jgi:hypothetical protein
MLHRGLLAAACGVIALLLAGCGSTRDHALLSGHACLAQLSEHDITYRSIDINDPSDSHCHIDTAVRVNRIHAALNKPATMSCALADRLDEFEREVIQPLAVERAMERARAGAGDRYRRLPPVRWQHRQRPARLAGARAEAAIPAPPRAPGMPLLLGRADPG